MIHSFFSLGVSTILWYAVGFSLSFSGGEGGVIGNLDSAFLSGVSLTDAWSGAGSIPIGLFFVYQMMFAVITPALITGAFTNRIRFGPYVAFLILWQLLVYYPFAHMVWGGGLLAEWGVLDFAGGIVVHASAGMAALGAVLYLGSRRTEEAHTHNIPFIAVGTALLWFGWFGFNAGSELAVDDITVVAFINTHLAASFGAVTWLVIEWRRGGQPKLVGLLTGAVAGLATITPAAGFVSTGSAAVIGVVAGAVCYSAVQVKERMKWDDALDVWAVHGVGGIVGALLTGVFAAAVLQGNAGVVDGEFDLLWANFRAVAATVGYSFGVTFVILIILDKIPGLGLRADEAEEDTGLDISLHGERGYVGDGAD